MGNSNSISQFTPNDIDLRQRAHWQYLSQQQQHHHQQQQQRSSFQQTTTSIRVLPELNDGNGHLRSTDNGVILFNGGTISGRREPVGVVQRSKSISTPHHEATRYLKGLQRHQTQLEMPVRSSMGGLGMRRDVDPKLFGSEPDLRLAPPPQPGDSKSGRSKLNQNGVPLVKLATTQQQQQQRDYDSSRFGWRPKSQQQQQSPSSGLPQQSPRQRSQENVPVEPPKKPRLFKTREETKKVVSSKANQSKLATEASDLQSKKPLSVRQFNTKRESSKAAAAAAKGNGGLDRVIKLIGNNEDPQKMLPKAEVLSKFAFRREKSFDISLLLSRGAQRGTSLFPNVFRKSSTADKHPPTSVIQTEKVSAPPPHTGESTIKSRRASQPPKMNDKDFQKELQEATRRRSLLIPSRVEHSQKAPIQKSIITQSPVLKAITKPRLDAKPQQPPKPTKAVAPKQPHSSKVEAEKMQLEIRNSSTTTGTRIEQQPVTADGPLHGEVCLEKPVKSFYYGMPEQERTPNTLLLSKVHGTIHNRASTPAAAQPAADDVNSCERRSFGNAVPSSVQLEDKVELTAIESFAESIFAMKKQQRDSSESAMSSDGEDALGSCNEDTLEGISLQLRPTLPKKQFEIPRFSPAAAWRLLSDAPRELDQLKGLEQHLQAHQGYDDAENGEGNDRNQDASSRGEEQIERIYREPIPGMADNKSGDSGISGDGGLLELGDSSPTNNLLMNDLRKFGPFLKAWTPQQDLEDDSSSDPDQTEQQPNNSKLRNGGVLPRTSLSAVDMAQKHVFSLSLPRDSQNSNLSEKGDKHFFSSLQKTKIGHCYPESTTTSRSQQAAASGNNNWFLSRSQPNSIEKNPMPSLSDNEDLAIHSTPTTTCNLVGQHHQPAIQPPSFNYLAGGCHFMYLPNRPAHNLDNNGESASLLTSPIPASNGNITTEKVNNGPPPPPPPLQHSGVVAAVKESGMRENLQDGSPEPAEPGTIWNVPLRAMKKGHRFTFQSTVRQIERRKLADKLSREAEEREVQRLSELDAMQKVEEEFQKKRAREKASIRQQLRLFSLEAAAFATSSSTASLPPYASSPSSPATMSAGEASAGVLSTIQSEFLPSSIRREPEGANTTANNGGGGGAGTPYCHTVQSAVDLQQHINHKNHQYQSNHSKNDSSPNFLSTRDDYSKFPYREFLK